MPIRFNILWKDQLEATKKEVDEDNTQDVTGVECGLCHEEVFRIVPRTVTHKVGVCPRCARQIDVGQEGQIIQNALKLMEKSERRHFLQEQSFKWAERLHGKKVVVYWDDNTAPLLTTHYEKHVGGTAYRTGNECGGWGRVKVFIDPTELHRISIGCYYTLYCKVAGREMYHAPASLLCGDIECRHKHPIIDAQRFGLSLNTEDGDYATIVSWGYRKCLVLAPAEKVGRSEDRRS